MPRKKEKGVADHAMDGFFDMTGVVRNSVNSAAATYSKAQQDALTAMAGPVRSAIKSATEASERAQVCLLAVPVPSAFWSFISKSRREGVPLPLGSV